MKQMLWFRLVVLGAISLLSMNSLSAQQATDSQNKNGISTSPSLSSTLPPETPAVGKEVPVAGGVLFVTAAEEHRMQKEISGKEDISSKEKRRQRRLKRGDRKEVTEVIGNSVNNYLANVTTVHTLQRF